MWREEKHHLNMMLLMMSWASIGTGFLFSSNQCVAPSPCTCSGSYVYCNSESLTDVPTFTPTTSKDFTSSFYVYLQNNQITSIENNAFQNFSSVNTTQLDLRLNSNSINSVAPDAFAGLENNTYRIDLSINNLTTLPSALEKMKNLQELLVNGNPIKSLDSNVMSYIGRSLTILSIDMKNFQSWPQSLNMLTRLQTLTANFIPFNHLPYDAFDGMHSTLTDLTMYYSSLYRIPPAICHLQKLKTFYFSYNDFLETNSSLFEPCSHKHLHLTSLLLNSNKLSGFPDILFNFPSLTRLDLNFNNIAFVPSSAIPSQSLISNLQIYNNALTRIPFAIHKIKNLDYLNLSRNKITSIEENDLNGMTSLSQCMMHGNPIQYIAPNAFKTNQELFYIDLENTKLTSVPEALLNLPKLSNLELKGNEIKCSCEMSYLKGWNVTNISFNGNCYNQANSLIKQYIMKSLSYCP